MNIAHSAIVSLVEGYVTQLRGHANLRVGGQPLSKRNLEIFSRAFRFWLILTGDLLMDEKSSLGRIKQIFANMTNALANCDLVEVLSLLDMVYELIINDELTSLPQFYVEVKAISGNLMIGSLLSPIKGAIEQYYCSEGVERSPYLRKISQYLRFLRKIEFESIGLEQKSIEEYIGTEVYLSSIAYDNDLLNGLNAIMKEWLSDFSIETLLPKHGAGSVAEGSLTLAQKYEAVTVDTMVKVLLSNCGSGWEDYFPLRPRDGLIRCSRTTFVPKTASKLRTISMEPVTLQYLQQGVMFALYRFIDQHPYLSVCIRLDDQTQNQIMALEGSKYHNYGTIDLSKASDTVSWELVKGIFRGTTLYKWLLATRSKYTVLPDGSQMSLKKYAPMGSALCFPIECLIFACIIEYVSRRRVQTYDTFDSKVYSVYGDDLVVPSELYDETIICLEQCGFIVNKTKSFNSKNYTESCGKEYYCGVDISPLYYRIPFYKGREISPSAFGSLCGLANNCYFHKLPFLRLSAIAMLQQFAEKHKLGSIRFVYSPNESPFLYSTAPNNVGSDCFYRKRYQVMSRKFVSVKSKQRGGEMSDDRLKYHLKLVDMARRSATFSMLDESAPSYALHGCIEYFSSCTLPCVPYVFHNLRETQDWDGT